MAGSARSSSKAIVMASPQVEDWQMYQPESIAGTVAVSRSGLRKPFCGGKTVSSIPLSKEARSVLLKYYGAVPLPSELIAKLTVRYVLADSILRGCACGFILAKKNAAERFSLRHFWRRKGITTGTKNDGDDCETEYRLLRTDDLMNCQQ
jgi:hypothetical protein